MNFLLMTLFYHVDMYTMTNPCDSKVIFISKAGKEDYSIPKSFRPIFLTSSLFKVLERVLLNKLEINIFTEHHICERQHAFRKGSSCDSALSDMVDNIKKSILRGEYAVGLFLDIVGAFDNVRIT